MRKFVVITAILLSTVAHASSAQTNEAAAWQQVQQETTTAIRDYIRDNVYPDGRSDVYPGLADTCDVTFTAPDTLSGDIWCEGVNGTFQATKTKPQIKKVVTIAGVNLTLNLKLDLKTSF